LDPNCECKLLDDDGKEVSEGEPGEMYVRGPNVCLRYWKNDEATKESISPDKWLKTGDITVVKNGWFWIVDRKKVSSSSTVMRLKGMLIHDRSLSKSTHFKLPQQN